MQLKLTQNQIFKILNKVTLRPMDETDLAGFCGVQGKGYIGELLDFFELIVVADVLDDSIHYEILDEEGDVLASLDLTGEVS